MRNIFISLLTALLVVVTTMSVKEVHYDRFAVWQDLVTIELPQPYSDDRVEELGQSNMPPGYVDYCGRHPEDCQKHPVIVPRLDGSRYLQLYAVNSSVNSDVQYGEDLDVYGYREYWQRPPAGFGDCEDYVLEKRQRLIDLGWPASALLIVAAVPSIGEGHALLLVVTDAGEFFLDSNTNQILPISKIVYKNWTFLKGQRMGNPNKWVNIRLEGTL